SVRMKLKMIHFHLTIEANGSLTLKDKHTNREYRDLCVYEDTGDIGNEYMYKQPEGEKALTTKHLKATIRTVKDTPHMAVVEITHHWELPARATDLLDQEQRESRSIYETKSNTNRRNGSFYD